MDNLSSQTEEALGWAAEADKFVDKDAAPAKDITFMDAAKFVAELTPVIGDAMAAKEVYDELQKDDPNYFLAGALGGAAIIGLIPGIGDAAAAAIRTGARKALDVGKRVEVDPDAVGMMGGNIRLKSKKTLDDFGYKEDNPVTKGIGKPAEDWLSENIEQANKSKNLLDGATTAFLGTNKDKPLFLDTDFISSLKGARGEVRKKGEPQYDRLKKTVDKEGFDPNQTILIEVNHKGEAYIVEGNTRAALAKELGVPNIKAEIRYKNGAELVDSPFSPQNILEKSSTGSYQDALAISKKLDEEMDSAFGAGVISKKPFKKTRKAYKLFIQRDGKLYPLFVNAADEVPMGEFLEADLPKTMFTAPNGRNYVPSKGGKRSKGEKSRGTGVEVPIPDEKTRQLLIKEGFITEKKGRGGVGFGKILAVAARPGWHASQAPVATHIGVFRDMPVSKKEVNKLLEAGITPEAIVKYRGKFYVKRREDDLVFAEVEMADDVDYQSMLKSEGKTDINDRVPKGGSYRYEDGQADSDKWVVGGDMRVKRILSREETKATQKELGVKDLPYRDEVESILGKKFNKGGLAGDIMYTGDEDYKVTSSYGEDEMQMNKGGAVDGQMQMAFMNEGGIADDGMDVDPVSGNEVPPGSLAEEVRDDIPAQLSEGEYVVPADVLRFYGMKFFEDLRENAKMELARMDREGRIGGQPVPANDNELTPEEMAELDSIGAAVGGFITGQPSQSTMPDPYQQQQMMYRQGAPVAMGNAGYQTGGLAQNVDPTQAQFDFSKYAAGFSFATPSGFTPVLMYKEGENPKYATTQEMYDQMLGDGWTTKLIDITTESKVSEELKVEDNDPGVVGSTDISSITDSIEDKDLEKTTKGLGLLADLSTALAGTLGIPATALINAKAVAAYNDKLTDQSKRKGSIFGGEGSIYEGLTDVSGDKERNFADTWLGDLLGFDKKVGVQGPKLRDSFMGARRGFDMTQLEGSNTSDKDSGGSTYSPSNSAEAQKDWMQATNAVKAAGNDHLARHKAIKAQSEASKKFTELKRAETSRAKDPSKVDPEAI